MTRRMAACGSNDGRACIGLTARSVVFALLLMCVVACTEVGLPQPGSKHLFSWSAPQVVWPRDPSAVIVQLYSPHTTAGLSGSYDNRYYIPEVGIWGDGRILWVERDGAKREVFEGHLADEELEALLQRIVEIGFFDWEGQYYTVGGHSTPWSHLLVNLSHRSKEVREHGGAPDAFYELERHLLNGAGADGRPFVPNRGYLTARPIREGDGAPAWPSDAQVTPEDVEDGRYIEGEALAFAWELLNRNPTEPIYVAHDGQVYVIMVQVPGVSYIEPPPPITE